MIFRLFSSALEQESNTSPKDDSCALGNVLLRQGAITRSDLQAALREQLAIRDSGGQVMLGELLKKSGKITEKQLQAALLAQHKAHLPDPTKTLQALDRLESLVRRSESRTREFSAVTDAVVAAAKGK